MIQYVYLTKLGNGACSVGFKDSYTITIEYFLWAPKSVHDLN